MPAVKRSSKKMSKKVVRKTSRRNTKKSKLSGGAKSKARSHKSSKRNVKTSRLAGGARRNTKKSTHRSKIVRRSQKGGNPDFQQSMKDAAVNPALEPEDLVRIYTNGDNFHKYVTNCPTGITPAHLKGENARNITSTIEKYKAIPARDPRRMQIINYLRLTDSDAAVQASKDLQLPYIRNIQGTRPLLAAAIIKKYGV